MFCRRIAACSRPCLRGGKGGSSCKGQFLAAQRRAGSAVQDLPVEAETEEDLLIGVLRVFALVVCRRGRHGGDICRGWFAEGGLQRAIWQEAWRGVAQGRCAMCSNVQCRVLACERVSGSCRGRVQVARRVQSQSELMVPARERRAGGYAATSSWLGGRPQSFPAPSPERRSHCRDTRH